jgi:hypothetical protein
MTREIVTSENREDFMKKKLGIEDEKKEIKHPMSKKDFHKHYVAQHKDIRAISEKEKEENKKSILKSGFKGGSGVNTLPISKGGEPRNIIDKHYGNQKGDILYLLSKEGVEKARAGNRTKEGHIPTEHEIIPIEHNYESTYDAYLRKHS